MELPWSILLAVVSIVFCIALGMLLGHKCFTLQSLPLNLAFIISIALWAIAARPVCQLTATTLMTVLATAVVANMCRARSSLPDRDPRQVQLIAGVPATLTVWIGGLSFFFLCVSPERLVLFASRLGWLLGLVAATFALVGWVVFPLLIRADRRCCSMRRAKQETSQADPTEGVD